MGKITHKELLDANVHMGHLTRKWDPRMAPYIFMEKHGIHIIDLNQTIIGVERAAEALQNIARSGRKIMFVGTKRQARKVMSQEATRLNMPFVTERWLGGMLTNFATIRKSIKRMTTIEKLQKDADYIKNVAKRERLMISREKEKLERVLGGIADLNRLPAAILVVDVQREHIAINEAKKLGIPVFAMVDTNSSPENVDFMIPANDDAISSISSIVLYLGKAIEGGLTERTKQKSTDKEEKSDVAEEAKA